MQKTNWDSPSAFITDRWRNLKHFLSDSSKNQKGARYEWSSIPLFYVFIFSFFLCVCMCMGWGVALQNKINLQYLPHKTRIIKYLHLIIAKQFLDQDDFIPDDRWCVCLKVCSCCASLCPLWKLFRGLWLHVWRQPTATRQEHPQRKRYCSGPWSHSRRGFQYLQWNMSAVWNFFGGVRQI